ncbi:hypothetical protein AUP68_10597 [Ilyonectria robusta]
MGKANEYYNKLGESPLFSAAIILHPALNLTWLEANWAAPEQLQWLQSAKQGLQSYFNKWYPASALSASPLPIQPQQPRIQKGPDRFHQFVKSRSKQQRVNIGGELESYASLLPQTAATSCSHKPAANTLTYTQQVEAAVTSCSHKPAANTLTYTQQVEAAVTSCSHKLQSQATVTSYRHKLQSQATVTSCSHKLQSQAAVASCRCAAIAGCSQPVTGCRCKVVENE